MKRKIDFRKFIFSFYYPILFAIPFTFVIDVIEKYIWNDWDYSKWLLGAIAIDTLTSWWFHLRNKDFSSKGFSMIITKLIIYGVILFVVNLVTRFTINGEPQIVFSWFRTLACTALIIREALSIVENLGKIDKRLVPQKIRKYLKDFDSNDGSLKENSLNNKNKENETL